MGFVVPNVREAADFLNEVSVKHTTATADSHRHEHAQNRAVLLWHQAAHSL